MKILFETDELKIEHEFESVYLIDKKTGKKLLSDDFYGDPRCGLIGKNNDWAIIGGEHLTVWINGKVEKIKDEKLKWIHSMRIKDNMIIEILTDPWSDHSAIWWLRLDTLEYKKISDFDKYKGREYCENVEW